MILNVNCEIEKRIISIKKKIKIRLIWSYVGMILLLVLAVILFVFQPFTETDIFFGALSITLFFLSPLMIKKDKVLSNLRSELKELESQQEQLHEAPKKRFDD